MDHEPRFDIFSGTVDKDARWIEAVRGLANARERMGALAKERLRTRRITAIPEMRRR